MTRDRSAMDRMVYELQGLTGKKIRIIEEATKGR
jgi:hypothetical protein